MSVSNACDVKRTARPVAAKSNLLSLMTAVAFLGLAGNAQAGVEPSPFLGWNNSFLFQGSGPENPLVRVGFNPQPEPPGLPIGQLDPSNPFAPTILIDVPAGTNPATTDFEVNFAMSGPLLLQNVNPPSPGTGHFEFQLVTQNLTNRGTSLAFTVALDLTTSGGGFATTPSWTFFNPQPEPPGFGNPFASAGFAFQFDSFSQASMTMQITDSQGNALSFSQVPEPTTLAILGLGLAGIGCSRRNRPR